MDDEEICMAVPTRKPPEGPLSNQNRILSQGVPSRLGLCHPEHCHRRDRKIAILEKTRPLGVTLIRHIVSTGNRNSSRYPVLTR